LDAGRARLVTSAGRSQTLVLLACPVRGPIARVAAWAMARVFTGRGPAYKQLLLGLAVLTFTVVVSALFLGRVIVAYSRRIKTIETALAGHDDLSDLPEIAPSGERELDRIVSALNAAGKRLGDARTRILTAERLAAIGAMAAGVAHEIRNPLAAMRLKSENALASEEPQLAKAALTVVVEQIDRLDELVGDLLSLAYFRAPKREPTDVGRVIAEAVKIHAGAAAMRGVKVTTVCELGSEERPWLDSGQIRRAIGDLLANAIEALGERPDGHVHIEARRLAASEGNRLLIAVNDNGPGVAEELRDRLFEPFATTRGGSHGLGLAIVREIARAHDGDARYLRGADGARFELVLPWLVS
jgi:signal transduction histidine kinase